MIANIITVVLTLGIVLVFRYIDKSQNPFEKLKKFTDKAYSDFATFFKEQELKIRNVGVDLTVKQEQAVAAVKRMEENILMFQTRTDDFKNKIAEINQIETRLDKYDETLKLLLEMTEKAEQNLENVQKHSGFINKFLHRIEQGERRLTDVEKMSPEILDKLEQSNEERIKTLSKKYATYVDHKSNELQALANEAVEKNQQLLDEINTIYESAVSRAGNNAEVFEQEVFDKLQLQSEENMQVLENTVQRRIDDLQAYVDRGETSAQQYVDDKLDLLKKQAVDLYNGIKQKISEKMQEKYHDLYTRLEQEKEKFIDLLGAYDAQVVELKENGSNLYDEAYKNIQNLINEKHDLLQSQFVDEHNKLEDFIQNQEGHFSAFEMQKQHDFSSLEEKIADEFSRFGDLIDEKKLALEAEFSVENTKLEDFIQNQEEHFSAFEVQKQHNFSSLEEKIADEFSRLGDLINEKKLALEAEFSAEHTKLEDFIQNQDKYFVKFEAQKQNNFLNLNKKIAHEFSRIGELINEKKQALDAEFSAEHTKLEDFIQNQAEHFSAFEVQKQHNFSSLEERIADEFSRLGDLINEKKQALEVEFSAENTKLEDFIQSQAEHFSAFEAQKQHNFSSLEEKIADEFSRLGDLIDEKKQALEVEFSAENTKLEDFIQSQAEHFSAFEAQKQHNFSSLERKIADEFSRLGDLIDEKKQALEVEFSAENTKLEDFIQSQAEHFSAFEAQNVHSFGMLQDKTKEEIGSIQQELQEHLDEEKNLANALLRDREERLAKLENDITQAYNHAEENLKNTMREEYDSVIELLKKETDKVNDIVFERNEQLANLQKDNNALYETVQQDIQEMIRQKQEGLYLRFDQENDKLDDFIKSQDLQLSTFEQDRREDFISLQTTINAEFEKLADLLNEKKALLHSEFIKENDKLTHFIKNQETAFSLFEQSNIKAHTDLQEKINQKNSELKEDLFLHLQKEKEATDSLLHEREERLSKLEHENQQVYTHVQENIQDDINKKHRSIAEFLNREKEKIDHIIASRDEHLANLEDNNQVLYENTVQSIRDMIQQKQEALATQFEQENTKLDDFIKSQQMRFAEFEQLAEEQYSVLREKTDYEIKDMEENFYSRLAENKNILNQHMDEQKIRYENFAENSNALYVNSKDEIIAKIETLNAELTNQITEEEKNIRDFVSTQEMRVKELLDKTDNLVSSSKTRHDEFLHESLTYQREKTEQAIQNQTQELSSLLDERKTYFTDKIEANKNEFQNLIQNFEQKLNDFNLNYEGSIRNKISEQKDELLQLLQEKDERLNSELALLQDTTKGELAEQENILAQYKDVFAKNESLLHDLENAIVVKQDKNTEQLALIEKNMNERVLGLKEKLEEEVTLFKEKLSENFSGISAGYKAELTDLKKELHDKRVEILQNHNYEKDAFFTDLEQKLAGTIEELQYRFERLESVGSDVDGLEQNLRHLIKRSEDVLVTEFEEFKKERNTAHVDFETKINEAYDDVNATIQNIDEQLNVLKTKAYDNVAEKLKVFEDDFFADLNQRGENLSLAITDWKNNFDNQLREMSGTYLNDREKLEQQYRNEIKEQFGMLQEKYTEQIHRFEENLSQTDVNLTQRMDDMNTYLHNFVDSGRLEVETAKADTEEYLKVEFEKQRQEVDEFFKRHERAINVQLNQIKNSVGTTQDETKTVLDSILKDLDSWQERLDLQFEENRTIYAEKLLGLQNSAQEQINQVQQIFSADIESYIALTAEQRQSIQAELDNLQAQSEASVVGYEERTTSVLEEFKKTYRTLLEDTQRRVREENKDTEHKLRNLKTIVQEVRDEIESSKDNMVLKIQNESNRLTLGMAEIDKGIKQFIAQTQLFAKADELKNNLEIQMGELRTELSRFNSFKTVAESIENQFVKIQKMDEGIDTKMQYFTDKKAKIDALETDFNNLLSLSSSMDQKIIELKNTSDDLQLLQSHVRRFQDTLAEIGSRYDSIEKKNIVIEQTSEGVDVTFKKLHELEDRLNVCSQQTVDMPSLVGNLRSELDKVLADSKKIEEVSQKIYTLDEILANTEKHIDEAKKTEDMLLDTEIRLTKLSKDVVDHINLFKTIKGGDENKHLKGQLLTPQMKQNIRRLKQQNWSNEDIAEKLNITVGEVVVTLNTPS